MKKCRCLTEKLQNYKSTDKKKGFLAAKQILLGHVSDPSNLTIFSIPEVTLQRGLWADVQYSHCLEVKKTIVGHIIEVSAASSRMVEKY